ncbi:hypothetical protein N7650_23165, partial [Pseudomonas sp. GD04058]|uniref:hypothetical protein n=1 Tax=Pseudomonas sp. GD04058 TaxID=2975429 RepID=UPI00244BC5FB
MTWLLMIGIGIAPSGLEKLDGGILANRADQCSLAKMMLVIGFGYSRWVLIEVVETCGDLCGSWLASDRARADNIFVSAGLI